MKTSFLYLILAMLLWGCEQLPSITLTNSSQFNVKEKSVVLNRSELEQRLGTLPEKTIAMLIDKEGTNFPAQLDDINNDGNWDVLFTQIDIKAGETKSFKVNFDVKEEIPVKTNIRFADINEATKEFTTAIRLESNTTEISQQYFQFEGPGWENDVVAFRNYFDARNGIDIFGKRTSTMVLDSCGLKGGPTYHEMQAWGMDILKVANSLGAGAIALETKTGLYRVGPNCEGTFTLIKEGPLRSMFDLDFKGIQLDDKTINLKHRITIEAGKPYYNSQVWVDGDDEAKLVTGIVNMHSDSLKLNVVKQMAYFFTYDNQAFDGEKLGLGIIQKTIELKLGTAPDEGDGITQTYYTTLPINKQPVEFYFMAGWEKQDELYATKDGFEHEIVKQVEAIQAKVELK